ncbi:claudin-16-like [Polypterus senegalus]|uniref:claudin-16-like n=1 Tax=Polypterus senegalus TaxID=55291 RepID=UPI0019636AF1|nr:claudin-16-like [Polypterus senegalus]
MVEAWAEVLALIVALLGLTLLILANETDCFRQDAKDQFASVGLSIRCRGLWSECLFDNTANIWTCDFPVSYMGELPAEVIVMRVIDVVTCGMCILAIPLLICGMSCIRCMNETESRKVKLVLSSGLLFLFGGVCGLSGTGWYAAATWNKYKQEVILGIPGVTYELGYSYWFAICGVLCEVMVGILLLIIWRHNNQQLNRREHQRCMHPPVKTLCLGANTKTYL